MLLYAKVERISSSVLFSRNVALLKTTVDRPKKKKQTHNPFYSRKANLIVDVMSSIGHKRFSL